MALQSISTKDNLDMQYFENAKKYQNILYEKEKQSLLPDISVEYFQGTNNQLNTSLKGYQFGLKIPFLFSGNASKINASKIAREVVSEQQQDSKVKLEAQYNSLLAILKQYEKAVNYYETQGENLKNEILKTVNPTFKEGEIDFFQYI